MVMATGGQAAEDQQGACNECSFHGPTRSRRLQLGSGRRKQRAARTRF
jgi:hypothetical protein